mmetsp:Transcript_8123/g.50282  ORF Transcript_8123/g.50282 Transcript_8123/m.50282 type:complete len:200 (+) Transcript_8123:886-1485(+)
MLMGTGLIKLARMIRMHTSPNKQFHDYSTLQSGKVDLYYTHVKFANIQSTVISKLSSSCNPGWFAYPRSEGCCNLSLLHHFAERDANRTICSFRKGTESSADIPRSLAVAITFPFAAKRAFKPSTVAVMVKLAARRRRAYSCSNRCPPMSSPPSPAFTIKSSSNSMSPKPMFTPCPARGCMTCAASPTSARRGKVNLVL